MYAEKPLFGGCQYFESTITVNGGRFKNFNPADTKTDPTSDGSKVSYLGDGCKSEQDTSIAGETWWVVTK